MERINHRSVSLPALEGGITRLETGSNDQGPLQALVLEQLFGSGQRVCWVDSRGTGTTASLGRLAPSRRLLDRVDIARGFTAYQHHQLVEAACERLRTTDIGLFVLPAFDYLYRSGDLAAGEARRLIASLTPQIAAVARETETPVLVTYREASGATRPLAQIVDQTLACEQTRFGPRFVGDDHETLVYHDAGGFQTTLAYWARLLEQRFATVETPTGVLADGAY